MGVGWGGTKMNLTAATLFLSERMNGGGKSRQFSWGGSPGGGLLGGVSWGGVSWGGSKAVRLFSPSSLFLPAQLPRKRRSPLQKPAPSMHLAAAWFRVSQRDSQCDCAPPPPWL